MESPFNEGEKRFVLAEMIKVSQIDVAQLIGLIQQAGVKPDWLSMQLPSGRNMNQCMRAWDSMVGQVPPPPHFAPEKRKSQDDLNEQLSKRPAVWSPPAGGLPIPPINTSLRGMAPGPNGYTHSPSTASPTTAMLPRKRGRPSRADMEARTRQRAAHTVGYAPIAPVPGPVIIPLEKPKKKGRRSAAERRLEPAVLPRRAHELPPAGANLGVQQVAPNVAPTADAGRPLAPAPPPETTPTPQTQETPTRGVETGGTVEKEVSVSDGSD